MAPLAGKPPFATDMPDSYYENNSSAQSRRVRQPAPEDPNKRSSAYDVYNNYMDDKSPAGGSAAENRQSGVGALGMGLLNMDDDDDSDDDESHKPTNKQAQLAAALNNNNNGKPPQPIAAPRPGYPAPIAALNLARPEAAATRAPPPQPLQIPTPVSYTTDPFDPSSPAHARNPFTTPSPSHSPHPLQPPITPITPVFARPAKITFEEEKAPTRRPIMRGNTEETLLPKRGEKGDDFWRRFSMVAKEPDVKKESTWLRKSRSGSSRLSRWVWIVGIILLICIAGAIGLGVYISSSSPGHQQPAALGGSANEAATGVSSSRVATSTGVASSTVVKVTPTHTVARRAEVVPSGVVERHRREREKSRVVF